MQQLQRSVLVYCQWYQTWKLWDGDCVPSEVPEKGVKVPPLAYLHTYEYPIVLRHAEAWCQFVNEVNGERFGPEESGN